MVDWKKTFPKTDLHLASVALLGAVLSACGGSGSADAPPAFGNPPTPHIPSPPGVVPPPGATPTPTPPSPTVPVPPPHTSSSAPADLLGTWEGKPRPEDMNMAEGVLLSFTVLDDGEIFAFISDGFHSDNAGLSLLRGNMHAAGGNLDGNVTEHILRQGITPSPLRTFMGRHSTGKIDYLTFSSQAAQGHVRTAHASQFDLVDGTENTHTLAELAGRYDGHVRFMDDASMGYFSMGEVNISASGQLSSVANSGDCSMQGTVTQRPNGGAAFNLTVTYDGPDCPTSGAVNQGIISMGKSLTGERAIYLYATGANGKTAVFQQGWAH